MPADPSDTDWTEARNLIFLTLKGQAVESLLSVAGREQLKLKLRDELNGIGKTPLIRAIYFTAFEIL
jgi:flagellar basal body-associated protein FliL